MSKYIKGNDGNIYAVDEFEVITTDEINTEITDLENQLAELKALLAQDEPAASNDNVTITDTFTDTETETITITNDAPAEPVAPTEQPQPEAVAVEQPTQPEPTPEQAPVIQ